MNLHHDTITVHGRTDECQQLIKNKQGGCTDGRQQLRENKQGGVQTGASSLERICKGVYGPCGMGEWKSRYKWAQEICLPLWGEKMDGAGTSCHILLTAMSQPHPLYIAIPHPTLPTPGRGGTAYLRVFLTVCEPSARRTRLITMPRVCPRDTELRVSILRPERS